MLFGTILILCSSVVTSEIIKGVPIVVTVLENNTVLLPCYMEGSGLLDSLVYWPRVNPVNAPTDAVTTVQWYRDVAPLSEGPRFEVLANYTLQITAASRMDAGDYTCQIIRPDPWGNVSQTHSLVVHFPPTLRTVPADGYLEVDKGQYVDIGCEADGSPQPDITWMKNDEPLPLLESRTRLRFRASHRRLSGTYRCVAATVAGRAAAAVRLVVHDAPEVTAVTASVHSTEGQRAQLTAVVEGGGAARGRWFRAGRAVKYDSRVLELVKDNAHSLVFRKVRETDFGNYTFRAENRLGMAEVVVRLTGVPSAASFNTDPHVTRPAASSYTLVWEVDSSATITEYNLWLRPYRAGAAAGAERAEGAEGAARWSKIVVPGEVNDGPIHSASYTIRGLTASTVYEAVVASRNRYGWSKPSAVLHFATEAGVSRMPSTSSYSETPVFEDMETIETIETGDNDTAHALPSELGESAGGRPVPSWSAMLIFAFWRAF